MMRSLYSAISGLKNHQTRMDVIGNNISNVNTVGFKASRVIFQDIYSQTSAAASQPTETSGGTNPRQVGLGMTIAAIDTMHRPSSTQITDNPLDVAIQGDGYFVIDVTGTGGYQYTRAGNFYLDNENNLVTAAGYYVVGINAEYDATKEKMVIDDSFDPTDPASVVDFESINIPEGFSDVSIDANGEIWGVNDETMEKELLAKLVMVVFNNPSGLEKAGGSLYNQSANSGAPEYTFAGTNGASKLGPGGLEMSNVDLAAEMTDMIVTQRGFQANSRVITVSDTLLEELVNLKR